MAFCLDANVVIAALNQRSRACSARLDAELDRGSHILISTVVLFELRYGIAKSDRVEKNATLLASFLAAPIEIAAFEEEDAAHAGDIRAYLEGLGAPIGAYDILIAAQARRREAVLVTANRREFNRVPGLMVMDWNDR